MTNSTSDQPISYPKISSAEEAQTTGTDAERNCAHDVQQVEFLTETQLAERWQVSVKLIQKMRYEGTGVPYLKMKRLVRYPKNQVLKFEQDHMARNTFQAEHGN